ncbi:MAG TPA: ester cyclase [Chloroflexota bacterium]|jgi:predicted ester cyclase
MPVDDNKALVRRVLDIINQRNLDAADDVIGSNYVYHSPGAPEVRGPEGFKQLIGMYLSAFPDIEMSLVDMVAENDLVMIQWAASGTHQGEIMGVAPTGKRVTMMGMIKSRVVGNRIVEDVEVLDTLGLLQQLGGMPIAESVASA